MNFPTMGLYQLCVSLGPGRNACCRENQNRGDYRLPLESLLHPLRNAVEHVRYYRPCESRLTVFILNML